VQRTNRLRERLQLPPSSRIVLYHGALVPGRALEELIVAARGFRESVVLVIVGQQIPFYHDVLEPLWWSEGLQRKVFFLPHVSFDNVMGYVASADLGVVIYRNINLNNYYCAPTKVYEYMMADVPFVACNFPEMQRLLEDYKVGLTFDPDDPSSIAGAVNTFFELDGRQRAEMQRDLRRARERFNWETESQKLVRLLQSLV
jgi:glycosyltransferase involved in cell wall biosynthesis